METKRTLAGTPTVRSQAISGGCPVKLVAEEDVTWLDQAAVDAIQDMASQAGTSFTLIWEFETHTIIFRHDDPPTISFRPLWLHHNLFTGTIKLMEI